MDDHGFDARHTQKAAAEFVERLGNLGPSSLRAFGIDPAALLARSPTGIWLDLCAMLQLTQWYVDGLGPYLPDFLPTPSQAGQLILDKLRNPRNGSDGERSSPVALLVMYTWLVHFSWDQGIPHLLLTFEDDDDLVEKMAQFLWRNRGLAHELTQREGA